MAEVHRPIISARSASPASALSAGSAPLNRYGSPRKGSTGIPSSSPSGASGARLPGSEPVAEASATGLKPSGPGAPEPEPGLADPAVVVNAEARRSSNGRQASRLLRAHSTRVVGTSLRLEPPHPRAMPVTSLTCSSAIALSSSRRMRAIGSGLRSGSSPAATLVASWKASSHWSGPSVRINRRRSPSMLRRKSPPPGARGSLTCPMLEGRPLRQGPERSGEWRRTQAAAVSRAWASQM